MMDTEYEQSNRTGKRKEVFEVGWSVCHIDNATKSRITNLTRNDFKIDQSINRRQIPHANLFQHWLPRLPRPDKVECIRLANTGHVRPYYQRQDFKYGSIQTMNPRQLDHHFADLVHEYLKKGPIFFVGHDVSNEHVAFEELGLERSAELLKELPCLDTQKLFSWANHCTFNREKMGLDKLIAELYGVPVAKIPTFFTPHNAGNDSIMTGIALLFKLMMLYT
jgi:hypothetical protein